MPPAPRIDLEGRLADIARFGTPPAVYSRAALTQAFDAYQRALGLRKVAGVLLRQGQLQPWHPVGIRRSAPASTSSPAANWPALAAGGDAGKVIFSGVGKTAAEMRFALDAGIGCFNVESAAELDRLAEWPPAWARARPSPSASTPTSTPTPTRTSPPACAATSSAWPSTEALDLYRRPPRCPSIEISGIDCHIGSQLLDPAPMAEAADKILGLVDQLGREGINLDHIDLGGGLGIRYRDEEPPTPTDLPQALLDCFAGRDEALCFEPGRPGGQRRPAADPHRIPQARRREELRHHRRRHERPGPPGPYDAYHEIVAVAPRSLPDHPLRGGRPDLRERRLPRPRPRPLRRARRPAGDPVGRRLRHDDELQLQHPPRAAEVLVDGDCTRHPRARETLENTS